jgi:hypothetical protein
VNRANASTESLGIRIADIGDRLLGVESVDLPKVACPLESPDDNKQANQ